MRFVVLVLVVVLVVLEVVNASPIVRTQGELEMARARHANVPLWGLVFDEARNGTHAHVVVEEKVARSDPREGVTVAIHASAVAFAHAFGKEDDKPIALNELALNGVWKRRRLGASSYVSVRRSLLHEDAHEWCSGLLVHWRGEKQLARTTFADMFERKFPGVPHAEVCAYSKSPPERALIDRLPVDPQQHTLLFFAPGRQLACFAHMHAVDDMSAKFDECTKESTEWFHKCFASTNR